MKIIKNPDTKQASLVAQAVKDNDGYCPCKLEHSGDGWTGTAIYYCPMCGRDLEDDYV